MALLDNVVRIFSTFLKHAAPATPETDMVVAYVDTDKIMKTKDDAGAVMQMVPQAVIADDTKVLGNVGGVLQYVAGPTDGTPGADGADGVGVPVGGTAGQVLSKIDGTDYNTHWVDPPTGTGGGAVDSVNGATGTVVLDAGDINCTDPTDSSTDTVDNALAHLFTLANSGKSAIAAAIGSPASGSDSFTTLAGRIDTDRATMATNLTAKGVTASSSETLVALAAKIADIDQEGGGGTPEMFITPTLTIPTPPTLSVSTSVAAI